jgi:hypothetical protein
LAHAVSRGWAISDARVVMVTTTAKEMMMTKLKILVVATLLIASASTAFAQRVPGAQGTSPTTETHSGPFSNMNRAE